MEYQIIINLYDDTQNQISKFRTKNWVKINDALCITPIAKLNVKPQC